MIDTAGWLSCSFLSYVTWNLQLILHQPWLTSYAWFQNIKPDFIFWLYLTVMLFSVKLFFCQSFNFWFCCVFSLNYRARSFSGGLIMTWVIRGQSRANLPRRYVTMRCNQNIYLYIRGNRLNFKSISFQIIGRVLTPRSFRQKQERINISTKKGDFKRSRKCSAKKWPPSFCFKSTYLILSNKHIRALLSSLILGHCPNPTFFYCFGIS